MILAFYLFCHQSVVNLFRMTHLAKVNFHVFFPPHQRHRISYIPSTVKLRVHSITLRMRFFPSIIVSSPRRNFIRDAIMQRPLLQRCRTQFHHGTTITRYFLLYYTRYTYFTLSIISFRFICTRGY